jgi:hypothetical protein
MSEITAEEVLELFRPHGEVDDFVFGTLKGQGYG